MADTKKHNVQEVPKAPEEDEQSLDIRNPESEDEGKSLQRQKAWEESTGLRDPDAAFSLVEQVLSATCNSKEERLHKLNTILNIMHTLNVGDPLEAMLIGQMIALNDRGMDCFKKSKREIFTDKAESYERHGIRLFKSYASLLGALSKHRSDCLQNLIINQVQVNKGGKPG